MDAQSLFRRRLSMPLLRKTVTSSSTPSTAPSTSSSISNDTIGTSLSSQLTHISHEAQVITQLIVFIQLPASHPQNEYDPHPQHPDIQNLLDIHSDTNFPISLVSETNGQRFDLIVTTQEDLASSAAIILVPFSLNSPASLSAALSIPAPPNLTKPSLFSRLQKQKLPASSIAHPTQNKRVRVLLGLGSESLHDPERKDSAQDVWDEARRAQVGSLRKKWSKRKAWDLLLCVWEGKLDEALGECLVRLGVEEKE